MSSFTFALDESGAKGYSDNREKVKGELGVVAGVLIPTEHMPRVAFCIERIIEKFKPNGKLHITDLSRSDQESLRREVFEYLTLVKARWVYEAIYVEGFYSTSRFTSFLQDKAKQNRRSSVKVSANKKEVLLHSELLLGAFLKAVAFCLDRAGKTIHLDVITDQLDASIVKAFRSDANRVLNVGKKIEHKVTGFDTTTKKKLRGSISTEVIEGTDALGDFSGVTFEIAVSDNPLTVIADIVANSVNYHLSSLQDQNPGCRLNALEAISGHPLAALVYGVTGQETDAPQVADTIFQHP